jgi:hypothetical protein
LPYGFGPLALGLCPAGGQGFSGLITDFISNEAPTGNPETIPMGHSQPPSTITMHRSTFPLFIIALLLFLVFGSVLPDPVGKYSTKMRNATNQFVIGLFPKARPKLNPDGRTEKQLDEIEQRK